MFSGKINKQQYVRALWNYIIIGMSLLGYIYNLFFNFDFLINTFISTRFACFDISSILQNLYAVYIISRLTKLYSKLTMTKYLNRSFPSNTFFVVNAGYYNYSFRSHLNLNQQTNFFVFHFIAWQMSVVRQKTKKRQSKPAAV